MSFASLPECIRDCLATAVKTVGCTIDDTACICAKDLDDATGSQMLNCAAANAAAGKCPNVSDLLNAQSQLTSICAKYKSASGSLPPATSSPPSTKSSTPPYSRTTTAPLNTQSVEDPENSPSSSPSSSSSASSSSPSGLSAGAAAGIGVGGAVLVMVLIIGAFLLWKRRRKQKGAAVGVAEENNTPEIGGEPKYAFEVVGDHGVSELGSQDKHTPELDSAMASRYSSPQQPFETHQTTPLPVYELPEDSNHHWRQEQDHTSPHEHQIWHQQQQQQQQQQQR